MYRIAVCEDEASARETICGQCRQVTEDLGISSEITAFGSAEELEAALNSGLHAFDLLVLDIQLGGKTGLELAQSRRKLDDRVSILFTTSCEDYLREGYSVQPVQFLLKPVTPEALRDAIATDWRLRHAEERAVLWEGSRMVVLPIRETAYIESRNHIAIAHVGEEERSFRLTLTETERFLPPGRFCRCHNSFLVNFAYISEFKRNEVLLRTGAHIPIGRKYYADAQNAFIRYINQ